MLEVYNRHFWRTLFACNFQINKKAYPKTLKFLPILPNISMTPVHTKNNHIKKHTHKTQTFSITLIYTKKNSYIKKGYLQTRKYSYNPFYSNNFLKVTIFIKSIHKNPKHLYNLFSH